MRWSTLAIVRAVALAALLHGFDTSAAAQTASPGPITIHTQRVTVSTATGTFDVTLTPQPADANADGTVLGRLAIDKQFHGDIEATSKGQMLTGMTSTKGSAGYVAIERVTGSLKGRRGTFILQHSGTMTRGAPRLIITVVPDSGTDDLVGLAGTMVVNVADGRHSYEFTYTLPDKQ